MLSIDINIFSYYIIYRSGSFGVTPHKFNFFFHSILQVQAIIYLIIVSVGTNFTYILNLESTYCPKKFPRDML